MHLLAIFLCSHQASAYLTQVSNALLLQVAGYSQYIGVLMVCLGPDTFVSGRQQGWEALTWLRRA